MTTTPERRATKTVLAFHASRIVIDVGVLLVMGAMSLPFIETAGGNRSSVDADALPALILVLPIFAVTLVPDHTRPIPRPLGWASLVLGLAAFPYSIVKFFDAGVLADTLGGSVGIGARLLVFGTFVVVAGIAIGLTRLAMNLPTGGTPGARPTAPTRRIRSEPDPAEAVAGHAPPAAGASASQHRTPPGVELDARQNAPATPERSDEDDRDRTQVLPRARREDGAAAEDQSDADPGSVGNDGRP